MLIRVREATKAFRRREVLAGVSMEFGPGLTALVGPSGAGKTTLLAVMVGAMQLDAGEVTWESPSGWVGAPSPREVAWVPQGSNLITARTGLDNVIVGALSRHIDRDAAAREARELLDRFGLGPLCDQVAGQASGGEQQRLCLCRAVATGRPVLLADEPTASLDAESTSLVIDQFAQMAGDGLTIVVASHDPALANVATRIEVLR